MTNVQMSAPENLPDSPWRNGARVFVVVASGVITSLLFLLTLVVTVTNWWDPIGRNNLSRIIWNIFVVALVLISCALLYKLLPKTEAARKIVLLVTAGYVLVACLIYTFLINGKVEYFSDPAYLLGHLAGDKTSNLYLEWYPHQLGFMAILRGIFAIFGYGNLLPLYFLNILACVSIIYSIHQISRNLSDNPKVPMFSSILLAPCMSFLFAAPYLYGDIIGSALGIGAAALVVRFISVRPNPWLLGAASILFTLAVFVKSSLNVVVLGFILYGLIRWITSKRYGLFLVAIFTFGFASIFSGLSATAYGNAYALDVSNGTPRSTWIAMGLMSGEYDGDYTVATQAKDLTQINVVAPGAFNGYAWDIRDRYPEATVESMNEMSLGHIKDSLSQFVSHPGYALKFFAKKQAYLWAEPTFGMTAMIEGNGQYVQVTQWGHVPTDQTSSFLMLLADRTNPLRKTLWNIDVAIQSTVYLCSAVAFISSINRKHKNESITYLASSFLTFFGVYLLWEAMSRYVFPGYLLLVPVAAYGMSSVLEKWRWTATRKEVDAVETSSE